MNPVRRLTWWLVTVLAARTVLSGAAGPDLRLVNAAKEGDREGVRRLLQQKLDVNAPYGDGTTALHWAAYRDDADLVRVLIAAGADVNARNDVGATPLWAAVSNRGTAAVEALLGAKADPNLALPSGESPLMTAAQSGDLRAVTMLLKAGADVNAQEQVRGQTALIWAVSRQHPEIVKALVEGGANLQARSSVRTQVVNRGGDGNNAGTSANPPDIFKIPQGGYTPLLFAARQGDVESARILLAAGASANDTAPFGLSALTLAAHSGNGPVAQLLLEHGADPNAPGVGYTALHAAILRGDQAVVRALLDRKADANAPVIEASYARRTSADYQLPKSVVGATPYWLAARYHEPEMMRALAAHGADARFVMTDGSTAVMAAVAGSARRSRVAGSFAEDAPDAAARLLETVSAAVSAGADVNAANAGGDTALHLAAGRGMDGVIEALVAHGARLDVRNKKDQTPLALAAGAATPSQGRGPAPKPSTAALLRKLGAVE
jgi:ankyrin repeat protein